MQAPPKLDFERHFRNIHKEAKFLSKFSVYDEKQNVLKREKGKQSKTHKNSLPRSQYQQRVKLLLHNFKFKDATVLLSMKSKFSNWFEPEQLNSIYDSLLQTVTATALYDSTQDKVLTYSVGDAGQLGQLTEDVSFQITEDGVRSGSEHMLEMLGCIFGRTDALEHADQYQLQCRRIAQLLDGEEEQQAQLSDVEETELKWAATQLYQEVRGVRVPAAHPVAPGPCMDDSDDPFNTPLPSARGQPSTGPAASMMSPQGSGRPPLATLNTGVRRPTRETVTKSHAVLGQSPLSRLTSSSNPRRSTSLTSGKRSHSSSTAPAECALATDAGPSAAAQSPRGPPAAAQSPAVAGSCATPRTSAAQRVPAGKEFLRLAQAQRSASRGRVTASKRTGLVLL